MSLLLSFFMMSGASVRSRTLRGVAYGPLDEHRLDVCAPVGADGEAPVVVFVHSCWPHAPGRARFGAIGHTLASRGFVTMVPDFRACTTTPFPQFIEDVALATAWARDNAGRYGGDPKRLFIVGHSGGAYICAMLALDKRWLAGAGLAQDDLRGMVGISGIYDFLPSADPRIQATFGEADTTPSMQPIAHANADAPPVLLVSGGKDHRDPDRNSGQLARALRTVGARVAEIRYPGLGDRHGLHGLAGSLQFRGIALEEVERFIRLHSLG